MDPGECFKLVCDTDRSITDRAFSALDLLTWMVKGGANPGGQGLSGANVIEMCNAIIVKGLVLGEDE